MSMIPERDMVSSIVDMVTHLVFDERFELLLQELAELYESTGMDNPRQEAYRDALYAMVQEFGSNQSSWTNSAVINTPPFTPGTLDSHR